MKMRMVLVLAALASGPATQAMTLKENTQEFRIEGHFDPETADGANFETKLTYGLFILDNIEVGGRFGYEDSDNFSFYSAGPFAEMNFDIGNELVPFVGAEIDVAYGDSGKDEHTALAASVYGGAKYFLAENVALGARLVLSAATDKIYADSNGGNSTDVLFEFGMSYYLPP